MKAHSILVLLFVLITTAGCISTKSMLKNVDNNAPIPSLSKENTFIVTEYSKDLKYGFNEEYPVNVFYVNSNDENLNASRYLNALAGPNGEKITYTKIESCCPFPTKRTEIGAGYLDIYELKWEGQNKPIRLYINIYERVIYSYLLAFL